MHWQTTRFRIDLGVPRVMGIVNVTPDSFAESDPADESGKAIERCERLVREGALRRQRRIAVGERVGREVDDAHHPRLGEVDPEPRGLPVHRFTP